MSNVPEKLPPHVTFLYERFKSGLPVNEFFAAPENSQSVSKLLVCLERETGVKVSDIQLESLGITRCAVEHAQAHKIWWRLIKMLMIYVGVINFIDPPMTIAKCSFPAQFAGNRS